VQVRERLGRGDAAWTSIQTRSGRRCVRTSNAQTGGNRQNNSQGVRGGPLEIWFKRMKLGVVEEGGFKSQEIAAVERGFRMKQQVFCSATLGRENDSLKNASTVVGSRFL